MKETENDKLYSIGELSKIVKISKDALRFYDEIGLVKPTFISEQTAYRYYSDKQIESIIKILELKQFGFSLSTIKKIVDNSETFLIDIYEDRHMELLCEQKKLQEVIDKIELKIKQKKDGISMNRNILLVDDSDFMRLICKQIFEENNYKVVGEACNGIEAVEKYKSLMPDMVQLNIVMPEMNGIEALKRIKNLNQDAKVVICSAMGQISMVTEALLAGAQDFIVKPFPSEKLLKAIDDAFNNKRIFDKGMLMNLLDKCVDNTRILTQDEIDKIVESTLVDNISSTSIDEIIEKFRNINHEPVNSNEHISLQNIHPKIDEILQSQEDIKHMMREMLKKS